MLIIIQVTSWKWQFCVTSMITVELTRLGIFFLIIIMFCFCRPLIRLWALMEKNVQELPNHSTCSLIVDKHKPYANVHLLTVWEGQIWVFKIHVYHAPWMRPLAKICFSIWCKSICRQSCIWFETVVKISLTCVHASQHTEIKYMTCVIAFHACLSMQIDE